MANAATVCHNISHGLIIACHDLLPEFVSRLTDRHAFGLPGRIHCATLKGLLYVYRTHVMPPPDEQGDLPSVPPSSINDKQACATTHSYPPLSEDLLAA